VLMVFLLTGDFAVTDIGAPPCSDRLRRIIAKCLAFNPAGRYQSVSALRAALTSANRMAHGKLWGWLMALGGLLLARRWACFCGRTADCPLSSRRAMKLQFRGRLKPLHLLWSLSDSRNP
jgi:hypothetical protein